MKNTNSTVSYRNKHIIIVIAIVCIIITEILSLSGILEFLTYAGYAFIVGMFMGTFEKKDELTRQYLAKATEITFYVLIAVLFVAAIVIENISSSKLAKTVAIDM